MKMFWLVYVVCVAVVFTLYVLIVSIHSHRSMTRRYSDKLAYGTFSDFLREMASHNWERDPRFPTSFFDSKTDSEVHASVVRFDGVGMILSPLDWLRVCRYLGKNQVRTANAPIAEHWKSVQKEG